ncbi:MAG: ABC transporter permease [Prevotella sp.]|nr:ABC transporter permease [Prevotella sp.]
MTLAPLIAQSRKHYQRFYWLVSFAVILMTAVLTGSLLLGNSVRGTLVQRVGERLGKTETIITSRTGFMSDRLMQQPLLKEAQGYLLMDGFVSVGEKLLPVYVWGTDADSLSTGEVMINEPLRAKLDGTEDIVLHLPSHNLVPSGSLFVTKSYATQLRVHVAGVKSIEEGGNLLLKNEQTLPLNVFVSRQELAEKMELEGKINLVLSEDIISEEQLAESWMPELSGIHLTDSSLTSDGIFIPNDIVEKCKGGLYFSYLVNDLANGNDTIPYSFVTAVNKWQGEPLDGQDMILSDYAAKRLHVSEGDSVDMSYFIAKDLKNLETHEQTFRVKHIVPLADFMRDSLLIVEFPGLSHVEKCTDWDSDLPIKMERVKKEDEDFWYAYRQTPKAIVSYEAIRSDWSNAFGSATALCFTSLPDIKLTPHDAGMQIIRPRIQGIKGATGGVDFASLFLSLGFFIILSAILLMKNPLVEMFTQRRGEITLYRQMGFADTMIFRNLYREAFTTMLCTSTFGVLAGLLYSALTLWLLGNVWSGATHTEGFALHIRPLTVIVGWAIGLLICAIVLWWVVRTMLRQRQDEHIEPTQKRNRNVYLFVGLLILTVVLIAVNFIFLHNMMLFIACGLLWILTWGIFLRVIIRSRAETDTPTVSRTQMMWQSIRASLKQHLLAYWALALGVFTVFAVGLNRPDFSQATETTGGYQYYVDSRVPIQYDLNNSAVHQKLSLESLPDSTQFLGFLRHTQDEASCLNLNQVSTPTVLGVDLKYMEPFGLPQHFSHLSPLTSYIYIDEESLIWSLKKSVGDTLYYQNDRAETVPVVIAGTYPTGIFHGNAIMSAEDFRRLWPKESGVEVLLMKSSRPDEAAEILSTAMNEYGLNVQTVGERIQMFFEVTETYLLIFLTLGGLGLLLGIFSLMIIVRKNLTAQTATIQQYRAIGFGDRLIQSLLLRENLLVPLYAVAVGATGSVISINANIGGAGATTLLFAALTLAVLAAALIVGIRIIVKQYIINTETI